MLHMMHSWKLAGDTFGQITSTTKETKMRNRAMLFLVAMFAAIMLTVPFTTPASAAGACGGGDTISQAIKGWKNLGVLDDVARSTGQTPRTDGSAEKIVRTGMVKTVVVKGGYVTNSTCSGGKFRKLGKKKYIPAGAIYWVPERYAPKCNGKSRSAKKRTRKGYQANCGNFQVGNLVVKRKCRTTKAKKAKKPAPQPIKPAVEIVQTQKVDQDCKAGEVKDDSNQCVAIQAACSNVAVGSGTATGNNCNVTQVCVGNNVCNPQPPPPPAPQPPPPPPPAPGEFTASASASASASATATASVACPDGSSASGTATASASASASASATSTVSQQDAQAKAQAMANNEANTAAQAAANTAAQAAAKADARANCPAPPQQPPPPADRPPQISVVWPPHVFVGGNQAVWIEVSDPDGDAIATPNATNDPRARVNSIIPVDVRWDGSPCPAGMSCFRGTLWGDALGMASLTITATAGGKSTSVTGDVEVKTAPADPA